MIGIEAGGNILPSQIVPDHVPHARLAAARLESVAVAIRGARGARVDVPVAHGPGVFDDDWELLVDQIVAVVRVPPRAAASHDRGRTSSLVVHAKAIGIL